MRWDKIHGLSFVNLLILALVSFFTTPLAIADDGAPKPFHIEFTGYQLNSADGTYMFALRFPDVPRPHVVWLDEKNSGQPLFKIGDKIGQYQIVDFKLQVETKPRDGLDDRVLPVDHSKLIIQETDKADERISIPYRCVVNVPGAVFVPESK